LPSTDTTLAKRVSQQERRHRVLRLKMAGGSDRDIAEVLALDPERPVTVSHTTVNTDWHEALTEQVEAFKGQWEQQRMLANTRLERLLAAVWPKATQATPLIGAVAEARAIIKDQRALFGLDRELGDPERPLTIQERVSVDYSKLPTEDLLHLKRIAEANGNVIDGFGGIIG
jgi:DNA-binding transcriptional MerR regulator